MAEEITQEMMKNARTSGDYDRIWATRGKCVFCDLKDKYILMEENGIVLTISLYPYIDGQVMAVPRRHVRSPKELSRREWETIRKFNYIAKKMIRKAHGIKSMWTLLREGGVEAGMSVVDHMHVHYIPFDRSDLCQWDYRQLKFTPLENVDRYRQLAEKFAKANHSYEEKYKHSDLLNVAVDAIIMDKKQRVLFQERAEHAKFKPDYLSVPGGRIDDADSGLLPELKRELREELNYEINADKLQLLNTQIYKGQYQNYSKYLQQEMPINSQFVWVTYLLRDFENEEKLNPGDDCQDLLWMSIDEALKSERVTPGLKDSLNKIVK
jgi:diadenosine tetraphosphate (Ap4A) HIT family hydrolase/8-oxo-dGTP pyrophosphatase MutT (NUDIX family)